MATLRNAMIALALAGACATGEPASAEPRAGEAPSREPARVGPEPEVQLGVADTGIFSDLDDQVQLALPSSLDTSQLRLRHDKARKLVVLYEGAWPLKVYPADGDTALVVGGTTLMLRSGDARELRTFRKTLSISEGPVSKSEDRDSDGIPDTLDVLLGAHKTALNGASYGGGYRRIDYPGGDIPREDGVCTDVVVRAVRNAGLDLQEALQKDIRRAPKAFSMVKKRNPNIDHRRVKTLLPYFERQWDLRASKLDDPSDPLRPGDVVFMDTFPKRKGPDHIGILSDRRGRSGHLLVINNWTDGFKTAEMDLLGVVPVTHRFRIPKR